MNVAPLKAEQFTDATFGVPTVRDILKELEKPGRDPRPEFRTASFKEGVEELKDLQPGMVLEGVVTNVTNFGAFIARDMATWAEVIKATGLKPGS